jgi:serine/threonine-protein kinase
MAVFLAQDGDYDRIRMLGKGTFGQVWLCREISTGDEVAVKYLHGGSALGDQRSFMREVGVALCLPYHGVVRLRKFGLPCDARVEGGVEVAPAQPPLIVTDFIPGGTLKAAAVACAAGCPPAGWGATQWTKALFGVAAVMARVHARRVVHRDIKPDNILLDAGLEPWIADFGLARAMSELSVTKGIGSPLFMAPELLESNAPYSYPVDVYAYAVTVFSTFSQSQELEHGTARTMDKFLSRVMAGERLRRPRPGTPAAIPDPIWELIEACWRHAATDRPLFREIAQRFVDEPALWIPGTDPDEFNRYRAVVFPEPVPEPPSYTDGDEPLPVAGGTGAPAAAPIHHAKPKERPKFVRRTTPP